MRKDNLNRRERLVAGVAAGILMLLLSLGGVLLVRSLAVGGKDDAGQRRLNTLTLVRTYVDKEEFDRALGLLEDLLIDNPSDTDASELLDIVLAAKKARLAMESGGPGADNSELLAALEAARQAAARVAAAADATQKAASRISAAEAESAKRAAQQSAAQTQTAAADRAAADAAAQAQAQAAQNAKQAAAQEAEKARLETEKQQKDQADAELAKRKALEVELANRNSQIQKQIAEVNGFIEQGKAKAASGSLNSALSSFEKAEAALPEGEKAFAAQKYTEMAEALYAISQSSTDSTVKNEALSSALEYANQAVAADSGYASARYLRSRIYTDQKKPDAALVEMKEAARLEPKNYLYVYELGRLYYLQKKFADAKQCFTTVVKLQGKFEPAFFNLGMTENALGSANEALAAFRSATAIKPDYVRAHIEIGRLLVRRKDYPGALSAYGTALKYEPANVSALRELATTYSTTGKFAEAERYFREALTLGSDDALTNYNMAAVQLELGKPDIALDFAKKAVDAESKNAVYLYNYGLAAERNGMPDIALQQYSRSIAADPKYVKPRINLGTMFLEANRVDDALNQLNAAYNLEKDNFEVNNNLGKAYGLKGVFDKSVDHYARAVAKNPKDTGVRSNLAGAYISAGLTEKARDTYVELLKIDGTRWDAYFELGKLYVSLKDKPAAKGILQELLKKKPDYPRAAEVQSLLDTL